VHGALGLHHGTDPVDPAFGVGEGAVLLQERRTWQEHVRELRCLVEEQVLDHHQLHRAQRGRDVVEVRIGLRDVFTVDEQPTEGALDRGVEHVRDPQPGLGQKDCSPKVFEGLAHRVVRHVPVAGELVREGPHVTRALHVVLAAQRVHADTLVADVAAGHRQVRHAHHHRRALAVLGDPETVVDGPIAALCVEPGGGAHVLRGHAGDRLDGLWAVLGAGDEFRPLVVPLAPGGHE
jgi:hypothetical protein